MPTTRNEGPGPTAAKQASSDPNEADLILLSSQWKSLSKFERADRLIELIPRGISRRGLARRLGCSESRIRQLVALTNIPASVREGLRSEDVEVEKTLPVTPEHERTESTATTAAPQELPQAKLQQMTDLIWEWITREIAPDEASLADCPYFTQFEVRRHIKNLRLTSIREVKTGPYGFRREEFRIAAPASHEFPFKDEPAEIIRRYKPRIEKPASFGFELINYVVEWFAYWGQRLVPDHSLRYGAPAAVARKLELET